MEYQKLILVIDRIEIGYMYKLDQKESIKSTNRKWLTIIDKTLYQSNLFPSNFQKF